MTETHHMISERELRLAPEIFEVRDDDFLYVLNETPDESERARVQEAVDRCPKQAISVVEL